MNYFKKSFIFTIHESIIKFKLFKFMTKGNNCDHQTPTDISCRDVDIRGNESDVMPPIHVLFTKGNCYIIKLESWYMYMLSLSETNGNEN